MYTTSEAYRGAIKSPVQQHKLHGQIVVSDGAYDFTEENVMKGSFSLSNQCSGRETIDIGSVYAAELSCTIMNLDIPRYSLRDAQIIPYFDLKTLTGWESVPLGVFYIKKADWTIWGVEITAYDGMALLENDIKFDTTTGKIWDFVEMACKACKVPLGMTKEQITALPNGNIKLGLYTENDVETWKDVIYWCASTTATIATFDRYGALVFRKYGNNPVDEVDTDQRLSDARFSDFETWYTAVKVTDLQSGKTNRFATVKDDGLTLDLGKNPFLQYGTPEQIEARCRAILTAISEIRYVPMQVSMIGDPAYDLTDVIRFSLGAADATKLSCITSFDWTFGDEYEMEGVGKNPSLEDARSKVDKELQSIRNSTSQDVIQFYTFTNGHEIKILDGDTKKIIEIRFTSNSKTIAVFHTEILLDVETTNDGIDYDELTATIKYKYNDAFITDYEPTETWVDGSHILHLLYYFQIESALMNHLEVYLKADGGDVTIGSAQIRSSIYGQNLAASDSWDGVLDFEDVIDLIPITQRLPIKFLPLTDSGASISTQTPVGDALTDEMGTITISRRGAIVFVGLDDEVGIDLVEMGG